MYIVCIVRMFYLLCNCKIKLFTWNNLYIINYNDKPDF